MRVLQISKFYPPVLGGIESVAWELTEGLNRAGVRTDVLCAHQRPFSAQETTPAGYSVLRAASLGMLMATSMAPSMVGQLWRLASAYDILHVHMPDPMAALAVWATRPKAAVVVHWHSDVIRQRWALKLYEPLQRWLLQRADAIVATSEPYVQASGPLQAWRHKVTVIPIGISDNCNAIDPTLVAAIRQRYRGRHIVFALGRMTYYKGFGVLIDAAAALPPDCVVLIGGDGELFDHYKALVTQRGLAGRVHLLGHVADHELASHFAACDVFCMPSTLRAEAYGVAMLEAMVMGKPIVASNIVGSGMPWVNLDGVTGYNTPAGNRVALGEALKSILGDTSRRANFGAASRSRYLNCFRAEQMVDRAVALYRTLL